MGHYSIREVHDGQQQVKYTWVIYAGNYRTIAASDRLYNNPQHALSAVKRFIRIISHARRNEKIVRLGGKGNRK